MRRGSDINVIQSILRIVRLNKTLADAIRIGMKISGLHTHSLLP